MAEDLGEKTEDATPKRRHDARKEGNVARSQDFNSAVLLTAVLLALLALGPTMAEATVGVVRRMLDPDLLATTLSVDAVLTPTMLSFGEMFRLLAPFMILIALAALITQLAQVGFLVSAEPLRPKFKNLQIVSGLAKLITRKKIVKGGMDFLKFTFVAVVAMAVLAGHAGQVAALPSLGARAAVVVVGKLLLETVLWLLVVLIILGIVDLIFQRWRHKEDMKMTKQEVKDERKSAEGDPKVRHRRMRMYQQIVLQQINAAVPQADVVVTNPTHYSVALRYNSASMRAPKVVAKGADHLALRIRLIASSHRVPIVERPPLARALYAHAEVGQEIPLEQYEAVAEVLAYVYRLEGRAAS